MTAGARDVPFSQAAQLNNKLTLRPGLSQLHSTVPTKPWLPGYPHIPLRDEDIVSLLREALPTPRLDKMFPYLWLVATQSSAHVSPLHEQILRGREIIITENPEMHLIWVYNRVFIKPIPKFLLTHSFWKLYLPPSSPHAIAPFSTGVDTLRPAALGFMRTYLYLIRHKSDFCLAQRHRLIPKKITFAQWMTFIRSFDTVQDQDVTLRYQYGQLRLTRLNLWAKLALGEWNFHKTQWQYGDIFAQFYAPMLFIFGALSVILSSMQVGTQAKPEWSVFADMSAWFAVVALVLVAGLSAGLIAYLVLLIGSELRFALWSKFWKRK